MLGTAATAHATADTTGVGSDRAGLAGHKITIEHTFEAAHRLPHLGGKCTSLHGHSWRVAVCVVAPGLTDEGTIVEFGTLKARVRQWVDTYVGHGTLLGARDPLVAPLIAADCKVFRFGVDPTGEPEGLAADLAWPTVEAVAVLLARISQTVLTTLPSAAGARAGQMVMRETAVNAAIYEPVGHEAARRGR